MEFIIPKIEEEYLRTLRLVPEEPLVGVNYISIKDAVKAHYLIADYFINEGEETICGVKDYNILGSAIGRQYTGFGISMKWKTPHEICATLFYGLIKNHAFHDANKRTALLVLLYQLHRFGLTVDAPQKEFEDLAVNIASDNYDKYKRFKNFKGVSDAEIRFIADFLRRFTRKVDNRYYQITYQEFDGLLKKHGCYLSAPTGNFINVYKKVEEKSFLGLRTKVIHKRVHQIGFPGWKKQVNIKALKETLKACKLTIEYGVDSQSFFFGADSLNALIDEYSGPLKRLKNK